MSGHEVYLSIVRAIEEKRLEEPFGKNEFMAACPGFGAGTYNAFLYKHLKGNGKTSELFLRTGRGSFKLIRPFRYLD